MVKFSFKFLIVLLAVPIVAACGGEGNEHHGLSVQDVTIETQSGDAHQFEVELALTPEELSVGLMYREDMDDDKGMLFYFGNERQVGFWMKNTLIPLDMIFIKANGSIFYIHENAKPHDLTRISPDGKAIAVLEINAGLSDKLNIREGDEVIHTLFNKKSP